MLRLATTILALTATSAFADLTMQFDEGAPKDRFTLTNAGDCALPAMQVVLDIGTAPAGLIFDVTGSGAGVQVFQPFELVAGADTLSATPKVVDGDSAVMLDLRGLAPSRSVAFTIDVDDTGGGREITVNGSEISGATFRATLDGETLTGTFDDRAAARIPLAACIS
ncbi:putative aggregation factor core [Sulfitobacter noctilucicola]|uniref:Aggregation factor core n=1 Tax=Sulfitobacter noctilucicola TaxID=1342301 RepID=A0A7W6M7X0_9RHOB|nr:hypothetical protein [Sulfitobacter noctilucicola]KIN64779.1 putative aggregation factor core [Sulfitobacter noctilucicola]MBB4174075.1 hypothetical protein [Sulfitobacter noctilucicola]